MMFIFEWFLEVLQTLAQIVKDNFSSGGPNRRMWDKLRVMYGRGEIDFKTFLKLRDNLQKGYYIEGELQTYHDQGRRRLQAEGRYIDQFYDPEINRTLIKLYMKRAMLDEVRMEMRQALRTMQEQRAWIKSQAESLRESAQAALPDEDTARAYLEIRQDLLDRLQTLERRTDEVQRSLGKLDTSKAELGVYESELMLADSKEHYANVNLALHE